jgi:hypothetical protein
MLPLFSLLYPPVLETPTTALHLRQLVRALPLVDRDVHDLSPRGESLRIAQVLCTSLLFDLRAANSKLD